jgi:hypothetical protein
MDACWGVQVQVPPHCKFRALWHFIVVGASPVDQHIYYHTNETNRQPLCCKHDSLSWDELSLWALLQAMHTSLQMEASAACWPGTPTTVALKCSPCAQVLNMRRQVVTVCWWSAIIGPCRQVRRMAT